MGLAWWGSEGRADAPVGHVHPSTPFTVVGVGRQSDLEPPRRLSASPLTPFTVVGAGRQSGR